MARGFGGGTGAGVADGILVPVQQVRGQGPRLDSVPETGRETNRHHPGMAGTAASAEAGVAGIAMPPEPKQPRSLFLAERMNAATSLFSSA